MTGCMQTVINVPLHSRLFIHRPEMSIVSWGNPDATQPLPDPALPKLWVWVIQHMDIYNMNVVCLASILTQADFVQYSLSAQMLSRQKSGP